MSDGGHLEFCHKLYLVLYHGLRKDVDINISHTAAKLYHFLSSQYGGLGLFFSALQTTREVYLVKGGFV